jgi:hypothetical protein
MRSEDASYPEPLQRCLSSIFAVPLSLACPRWSAAQRYRNSSRCFGSSVRLETTHVGNQTGRGHECYCLLIPRRCATAAASPWLATPSLARIRETCRLAGCGSVADRRDDVLGDQHLLQVGAAAVLIAIVAPIWMRRAPAEASDRIRRPRHRRRRPTCRLGTGVSGRPGRSSPARWPPRPPARQARRASPLSASPHRHGRPRIQRPR